MKTALLNLNGFDDILIVNHISTSVIHNMMHRTKRVYFCLAFAIAMVCCADIVAQESASTTTNVSVLQAESVIVSSEQTSSTSSQVLESTVVPESYPAVESDLNAPIIIQCDDDFCFGNDADAEQCVVVKKSPLGCMEGITILPQDEVWFINARECVCGETDLSMLKVSQIVGGELLPRQLNDLTNAHASGDELATVLYVHGNQTNQEYAMARGLQVYRNAFATKADYHGPVRYVIWAWKSEQEKVRLYPDYLVKSERSLLLGETFAATLNQFSDRNIVVFGYSLGVQVVLSAFDSPSLSPRLGDPTRYQIAFAAPAINSEFVACNLLKADCISPAEQALVFTNRKDRAIRAAQSIIRRKNPGTESTISGLSEAGKLNLGSITSIDVYDETGRFHSIERYTRSSTLQSMVANLVNIVAANRSQPLTFTPNIPQRMSEAQGDEVEISEPVVPATPAESVFETSHSTE